jgi:DNA replication protein DnaC
LRQLHRRYEHASTVLTSNKTFEEWGEALGDEVMAAALIDRVLHHCHLINIPGNNYRVASRNIEQCEVATATLCMGD